MGQKIHPLGFRIGITKKHKAKWFANSDQYPQYILEDILLRKLLTALFPPESLPRVFEDDKKMRIVEIKIERFIRNTIQIQIYAVNSDLSSLLLDPKIKRNSSFEENKNSNLNFSQRDRKISIDANSKKELIISDDRSQKFTKWKNVLRKKIFELKCYQFKNIIKKCNFLLELSLIYNKTKQYNGKLKKTQPTADYLHNKLVQIKRLSEKRHKINLFLQRILTHKTNFKMPTELEILKINLLYIYYNLKKYQLNFEILELQHDILRTNYSILKKFGILSKKWFINNNLRTIKRILKKFENKLEDLEKDQKINKFELNFLKFPEILLRNYLQNLLNQQNPKWVINKCHHRFQNEYLSRFSGSFKKPIELIKDLETYINWHSKTSSNILELNKKISSYYSSFRQLGQKVYLKKRKIGIKIKRKI